MKIEQVKKLKPLDVFLYWMRERYNIALRRRAGAPKPWTDDEILQQYFFTHPYREMDKVTVWFKENIREPLRDRPEVLFATVCFRWFNLPSTGKLLWEYGQNQDGVADLLTQWNPKLAFTLLDQERRLGRQIFTGAFMINSPPGEPKLEAIIRRINNVWIKRDWLTSYFHACGKDLSMKEVHEKLTQFDGMGGFMAYEVVCDLRYTYLLENAPDKLSWCNPGPGAIRGLYRILGRDFDKSNNSSSPKVPSDWAYQTQVLLSIAREKLKGMPPLEMREIEHSLCETDKYLRLLNGEGKSKRGYNGV